MVSKDKSIYFYVGNFAELRILFLEKCWLWYWLFIINLIFWRITYLLLLDSKGFLNINFGKLRIANIFLL